MKQNNTLNNMATQTPTIITQGAMNQDGSGVNKYNPNTGNLLLPGQSVQVNPIGNQVSSVNPVIDANVATGTTSQLNLPNRPSPQAQSNLYSQAASIIANLPKTGVAGLDQTNQVLAQLPAYLYEQQGIGAKQTANSEAQTALKLFDEESRQRIERERTNPQLGLETLAARTYAIEKDRAFMAGTLAVKAAAASQDYETAMTVMKTMNEMIAEPLRQNAQFFKEMYMKTEDQKFQRAMKASDQSFQREMKGLDQLNDLKMQAFKDGKITAEQLSTIRTIGDFAKITGISKADTELQSYALANKNDPRKVISYIFEKSGAKKDEGLSSAAAVVAAAQDLASSRPDGRFIGAGGFLFANRSALEAINLKVGQWASGASLTEQQQKQVDKMTPRIGDSDRQIRNKVNALTNFMMSDISGKLSTQGVNIAPPSTDFWSKNTGTTATTTTNNDIASKIGQAYANGYDDVQIVQALKVSNPELSAQIDTALQTYTPEEVVAFLMENQQ